MNGTGRKTDFLSHSTGELCPVEPILTVMLNKRYHTFYDGGLDIFNCWVLVGAGNSELDCLISNRISLDTLHRHATIIPHSIVYDTTLRGWVANSFGIVYDTIGRFNFIWV